MKWVFAVSVLAGALLVACASPSPSLPPSPVSAGDCPVAPEPPAEVPGWPTEIRRTAIVPVVASEHTCGENRLIFLLLDEENRPISAPDRSVEVRLFNLARDSATGTPAAPATFVWGIEDVRGYYVLPAEIAEAGTWGAEFTTAAPDEAATTVRVRFSVRPSLPVVRVGQRALRSETPVLGDVARISTDPDADLRLYETSVAEAVDDGEPFVLVFATPRFCQSALCGPALEQVKALSSKYPSVTFIHVEPYELEVRDGQLQPVLDAANQLVATGVANEWGLYTEPWVFVVDGTGVVRGSFGAVFGDDEIVEVLDAL